MPEYARKDGIEVLQDGSFDKIDAEMVLPYIERKFFFPPGRVVKCRLPSHTGYEEFPFYTLSVLATKDTDDLERIFQIKDEKGEIHAVGPTSKICFKNFLDVVEIKRRQVPGNSNFAKLDHNIQTPYLFGCREVEKKTWKDVHDFIKRSKYEVGTEMNSYWMNGKDLYEGKVAATKYRRYFLQYKDSDTEFFAEEARVFDATATAYETDSSGTPDENELENRKARFENKEIVDLEKDAEVINLDSEEEINTRKVRFENENSAKKSRKFRKRKSSQPDEIRVPVLPQPAIKHVAKKRTRHEKSNVKTNVESSPVKPIITSCTKEVETREEHAKKALDHLCQIVDQDYQSATKYPKYVYRDLFKDPKLIRDYMKDKDFTDPLMDSLKAKRPSIDIVFKEFNGKDLKTVFILFDPSDESKPSMNVEHPESK